MKVGEVRAIHVVRDPRLYGPVLIFVFGILSGQIDSLLRSADVALVLMGWCTWVALLDPVAGLLTTLSAGLGFLVFHTEPTFSLRAHSRDDIVTVALLAGFGIMVSVITMYRVNQAVVRLNERATLDAMDDFLETAMKDQPTIAFAQRAFEAVSAELAFIDVRLEKKTTLGIPTYDLSVWNHHKAGPHPRVIEVSPTGIAIKFENPRIWYELVFSSRRGYGTLPVRRFLLQGVANRMEEFLLIRLRLETKNGKH